jgi:alpha-galactosidase
MEWFLYQDCLAEWTGSELRLANSLIERRWQLENGLCRSVSLVDQVTGQEKLVRPSVVPAPSPPFPIRTACIETNITAEVAQASPRECRALQLRITSRYSDYRCITVFRIFPKTAAVTSWLILEGGSPQTQSPDRLTQPVERSGVEAEMRHRMSGVDLNEYYELEHVHRRLGVVHLMDHTDDKDNLVFVQEYLLTNSPKEELRANLFYLNDQFSEAGLIFLKEAPLPYARPVSQSHDLLCSSGKMSFIGLGLEPGHTGVSYPFTTMLYHGGAAGRTKVLQEYQRRLRTYDPAYDEVIWHSIWGDRNRDGKMCEEFLLAEMKRNADLGIDHIYFIDGWQSGPSSNSVVPGGLWENQWSRPDYWTPHPKRFPRGLTPIIELARELGMKVGMWYNPDKTNDYANWQRDTDLLLEMHHKYGILYFKFDGVEFNSKTGEENLLKAMHRLVTESQGRASVEIDITAGKRTGYFAAIPYGVLFLENRYTDFRRYYPHCTLRNLWQLAHFVDPRRLRIEFLNNERNQEKYPDDPLAPVRYSADYLFATAMFANPMAWLETAGLSDGYKRALKPLISLYKQHRERIHKGIIIPIGEEPSGMSWTSFQSHLEDEQAGYLIVFRELTRNDDCCLRLAFLESGTYQFQLLAGSGSSFVYHVKHDGEIELGLPEQLSYGLYTYYRI